MKTYYADEKIDYGKSPGKIASAMKWIKKQENPPMKIFEENDEWIATYTFINTSFGPQGEDVYILNKVEIK